MLALRTYETLRPFREAEVVVAGFLRWKQILKIQHADRISLHSASYHGFSAGDAKRICQFPIS
jgi:hypothetical protein